MYRFRCIREEKIFWAKILFDMHTPLLRYKYDIQAFFVIIVKILFYLLTFGLYVISILIIRGIMIYISIFYLRGNA